jgi:hypothetical protein
MPKLNSLAGMLVCAVALAIPPSVPAQGGAPAPDFSEPCPALLPWRRRREGAAGPLDGARGRGARPAA